MRFRQIPQTELLASVICLGTGQYGDSVSSEDAFFMMDAFIERGGNFIDTAKVYGEWVPGGQSLSETVIGQWLKARQNRSKVIVATKGAHPHLHTMHIPRLNLEDIQNDLESSLRNLQTDYIDLYWLHRDDPQKPVEELIDTLNEFVRQGKIRYFGCSNWRSERIAEAQRYANEKGIQGFAANQLKWSLAEYPPGKDPTMVSMDQQELQFHLETGLPAVPYNAQASGFFSGRYKSSALRSPDFDQNHRKIKALCSEANIRKLEAVEGLAKRLGMSMSQVALGYLLSQPFPVFPIAGCRSMEQLEDTCAAGEVVLDEQARKELEES